MYYEDLLETAVNDESSVDFRLRQKKAADALKRLDKQYEKYSIPFNDNWTDGKYYKQITIENYGSGSHGTRIRNAVTGSYYDFIVGSSNEDLFFKVIDSSGRNERKDPLMLYYDSPEQYENHHFTSVSPEVKQKWHARSLQAQKRLNLI
jgi:hypothetical protein